MRVGLGVLAGALLVVGYHNSTPTAFHSGGVAECNGCHSMHAAKSPGFLLVGTDQSSTCLTCHESVGDTGPSRYHISTPGAELTGAAPKQLSPGGDFGWLKKTYSWVPRTGAATEYDYGQGHGHNIVAIDYNYVADTTNVLAPGNGQFSGSALGCHSCHDPHGRARRLSDGTYVNAFYNPGSQNAPIMASGSYSNSPGSTTATPIPTGLAVGVYRLLRGLGDNQVGVTFTGVPVAIAPATYNQSENTNQVRVAYGNQGTNTWGGWCGTCHPTMHSNTNTVHPVDIPLTPVVAGNYNSYVKSGDLGGQLSTSYNSLVPFVESTTVVTTLASHASNTGSAASLVGASTSDQVSCLSCHRSHASGFGDMLRFGMGYEFMVYNGTYTGSVAAGQGRTEAEMRQAYYDRDPSKFASYQRVLCNKCHAKD